MCIRDRSTTAKIIVALFSIESKKTRFVIFIQRLYSTFTTQIKRVFGELFKMAGKVTTNAQCNLSIIHIVTTTLQPLMLTFEPDTS